MLGPVVMADYGRADLRLKRLIKKVSPDAPWEAPDAERLDAGFATWIRGAARTGTAREALTTACRAVFSVEPADVSLLHVLFYAAAAGGWDDLLDTEGGAQQDRLAGGNSSSRCGWPRSSRTGSSSHRCGASAWIPRAWRSERSAPAGRSSPARRRSPGDRIRAGAAGRPRQLTQRMPMGSVIKCMAVYEEPFWRAGSPGRRSACPVRPR